MHQMSDTMKAPMPAVTRGNMVEGGFSGKGEGETRSHNLDCYHCSAQAEEDGTDEAKGDAATCKEVREPACYGRKHQQYKYARDVVYCEVQVHAAILFPLARSLVRHLGSVGSM